MRYQCPECGDQLKTKIDDHHGPIISICGHSGADWDTLFCVLQGWHIRARLRDGNVVEGVVSDAEGVDPYCWRLIDDETNNRRVPVLVALCDVVALNIT